MRSSVVSLFKALGLIVTFSLAGFVLIKLAFKLVCWVAGHNSLEAMIGLVASIGFGGWIGLEGYYSLKDWRARAKPQDFDTSR
jgi:hypothetical protein